MFEEESALIEVKNLVKKYGNILAVDDLTFRVEKGEVIGLLGPNGAGKSTTMNMMTGYISSTEGTVTIDGYDIFEYPEEAKKKIGYLPEQPPIYMDMTVREYLQFVAELKDVAKKERTPMIEEIMKETKLEGMERRLIRNLSKGYKQRVGIAGALVGYPAVIILDEPTVGLDPKQIIEIRDLIRRLSKKHTVILSSHILSEVNAVCDRIMIINKGKLIVDDTPERLGAHAEKKQQLHLEIKGEGSQVVAVLSKLKEISEVKLIEKQDGVVEMLVVAADHEDIREVVFYALAEARLPIFKMEQKGGSLEDIFLELTKDKVIEKNGKLMDELAKEESDETKLEEDDDHVSHL